MERKIKLEDGEPLDYAEFEGDREEWEKEVREYFPDARWVIEDGTGRTYGEAGDTTVVIGPDMQSDVVAVWSKEGNWGSIYY